MHADRNPSPRTLIHVALDGYQIRAHQNASPATLSSHRHRCAWPRFPPLAVAHWVSISLLCFRAWSCRTGEWRPTPCRRRYRCLSLSLVSRSLAWWSPGQGSENPPGSCVGLPPEEKGSPPFVYYSPLFCVFLGRLPIQLKPLIQSRNLLFQPDR